MNRQIIRLAVASCILLFQAGAPCFAKPGQVPLQAVFSRQVTHTVLPAPPIASMSYSHPSGTLSPDGRWLAYFDARPKNHDKVVFYDLVQGRSWVMAARHFDEESFTSRVLAWRSDSRACAIGASGGWKVAWPSSRRVQRLTRVGPGGESCAAWSPRTNRLALFEGFLGNGLYRVWDGRRLTRGIKWREAVGYPYGEERAWQCEWSPDEKTLLFRFYGHAQRESYQSGHTAVVSPRTGRRRFRWGTEAGPARWLDNSRLIFMDDDALWSGTTAPTGLAVTKPKTRESNIWLENAAAWALAPQGDGKGNAIWAITTDGHLRRTSTKRKHWQIIRRNALPVQYMPSTLSVSPRGDMVAFGNMFGGKNISLVSTSPRRPWTISWRAPVGKVRVLGWAQGQTLPLLELQQSDDAPAIVIQLKK